MSAATSSVTMFAALSATLYAVSVALLQCCLQHCLKSQCRLQHYLAGQLQHSPLGVCTHVCIFRAGLQSILELSAARTMQQKVVLHRRLGHTAAFFLQLGHTAAAEWSAEPHTTNCTQIQLMYHQLSSSKLTFALQRLFVFGSREKKTFSILFCLNIPFSW